MVRGMSSLLFRTMLVTFTVLGFVLVLSSGFLQSEGDKTKTTTTGSHERQSWTPTMTTETLRQQDEQMKVLGKGKSSAEEDLNYVSKRRVPNGPDPIHNRRAGNSGRPPGRA